MKFITISIFLLFIAATNLSEADQSNGMRKDAPNITRLRVYWHLQISGKNPTSITVASATTTNTSKVFFGKILMTDNPLTERPERNSRLVGRAQGFLASASQEEMSFLMNMNLVFLEGEYNGSTITVLGQNPAKSMVRELSIVGGTGVFRLARGYVELRTYTYDPKAGDGIVQYDIVVYH